MKRIERVPFQDRASVEARLRSEGEAIANASFIVAFALLAGTVLAAVAIVWR